MNKRGQGEKSKREFGHGHFKDRDSEEVLSRTVPQYMFIYDFRFYTYIKT